MSTIYLVFVQLLLLVQFINADVAFNITRISSPRDGFSLIEAGSNLFFVGGFEFHDNMATDKIEVFDLENRAWSRTLRLPSPRAYVTPVVLEPHIYFVGGFYYSNPPFVYNLTAQQFLPNSEQGPTVLSPVSIDVHESTLTVIGRYSVDFLDLDTNTWRYNEDLTRVMMDLVQNVVFSYEDIIVVIGGTNITIGESTFSAWIFNRTSDQLQEVKNALTTPGPFLNVKFTVKNRVLSVWTSGFVFLHRMDSPDWYQFPFQTDNILNIGSTSSMTYLFDSSGYFYFDWNSLPSAELQRESNLVFVIQHAMTVNGLVAFLHNINGAAAIEIMNSDAVNSSMTVPLLSKILFSVTVGEWHCVASAETILVINLQHFVFNFATNFTTIFRLVAGTNSCHFFVSETIRTRYHFEFQGQNAVLHEDEVATMSPLPVAIIGNIFFGDDGTVGYPDTSNFTKLINLSGDRIWAGNDRHFVLMNMLQNNMMTQLPYNKMDIYNYVTNNWLNSTDLPSLLGGIHNWYLPAAVIGNRIAVWKGVTMGLYYPQTETWEIERNGTLLNSNDLHYLTSVHVPVIVVNDTAYLRVNNGGFSKHVQDPRLIWTTTSFAQQPDFGIFA